MLKKHTYINTDIFDKERALNCKKYLFIFKYNQLGVINN